MKKIDRQKVYVDISFSYISVREFRMNDCEKITFYRSSLIISLEELL